MKLTPSWRNVLATLAKTPEEYVLGITLPDGNGRAGMARGEKLAEMRRAGVIEYGKRATHSLYGYRITDLGLSALAEQEKAG